MLQLCVTHNVYIYTAAKSHNRLNPNLVVLVIANTIPSRTWLALLVHNSETNRARPYQTRYATHQGLDSTSRLTLDRNTPSTNN
jgi:hypothetical protein